ncbi:MAG: ABC transporter ATP-binding protein/permease [Clostridia bacterium]|nr:ABC transporter ATP-binding protein/permease [Clostridia bacterium]
MGYIREKIKKIPQYLREWRWLFRYIRKYWVSVMAYILLGVIAVLMGLAVSVASKVLIDAVVTVNNEGPVQTETVSEDAAPEDEAAGETGEQKSGINAVAEALFSGIVSPHGEATSRGERVVRAMCLVIGLALSQIIFNAIASWITANVNTKITNEIRHEIFERIMTSRWESLRAYHSGEILNRLEGDVNGVVDGIVSFIPTLVTCIVRFAGAFIIIMLTDPLMAVFALASAPILVFTAKPLMKVMRKFNEKQREINGQILSFNEEAFQNIQLVKAFDLTRQRCEALGVLLKNHRKVQLDYAKVSVWVGAAMSLIGLITGYACYGWAVYRLYQGRISYGDLTLIMTLSSQLQGSFSALVAMFPRAVSVATSAGRVMEITGLPAEEDKDAESAIAMAGKVEECGIGVVADHISFAYEDSTDPVMKNVSFSVHPGEIVAFVGPSGGGKTTTLRILLGLLKPQEGQLTVSLGDGSMTLPVSDSTRRLCAYVPQGNSVFSGTIEENLLAVAPDATAEQVEQALRVADAWEFVSGQPNGVKTVLGERGVNLSEGQLQRLAIARAVLRDAPILIMDEATSALDVDTESRVLHALMKANPSRIILITTHRASMLDYADQVIRVGEGCFEMKEPVKKTEESAAAAQELN